MTKLHKVQKPDVYALTSALTYSLLHQGWLQALQKFVCRFPEKRIQTEQKGPFDEDFDGLSPSLIFPITILAWETSSKQFQENENSSLMTLSC